VVEDVVGLGEALLDELDVDTEDPCDPLATRDRSESCQAMAIPNARLEIVDAVTESNVVVT
jgi:hypothetical protein